MNLDKGDKIFISHHHSQKEALSSLKADLEKIGFEAFLAHKNIVPGKDYLKVIEQELRDCDLFLYICNKESKASEFCQQEIGMAVALKKETLTIVTDGNFPKGFIVYQQVMEKQDLNNILYELFEYLPTDSETKRHLDILGCKGFSQQEKEGYIYLEKNDNWNDYSYKTVADIKLNRKKLDYVRIAFNRQAEGTHSFDELPPVFKRLGKDFFSNIPIESEDFSEEQKNSIKALLRDFSSLEFEERVKIYDRNRDLLAKSLFRDDGKRLTKLVVPF